MGPALVSNELGRRSVSQVLSAGLRFGVAWLGRRAELGMPTATFARALFRAARPHFFVFPAAACLAGAAAVPGATPSLSVVVAAVAVGVAWAVGQLLNDLVDLDADALDAPDRPAVRGLLPEGPTALVATALGLAVAVALSLAHPLGWALAVASGVLMLVYAPAKAWPLCGNLAHGALMALLALIGAAVAEPGTSLFALSERTWPTLAAVGALASLYLQGNYEKDQTGDARAGYLTIALVLGVRGSAALRLAGGAALYALTWYSALVAQPGARALWGLSALLLLGSAVGALMRGGAAAALGGYRWTVHSASAGFVALGVPLLGPLPAGAFALAAALLVELAFARSPNP
jgi:4-hydroxybenzoate polyprenyltransferase